MQYPKLTMQWLEALTGNHRFESLNPTGAKEFVLCSLVRHLTLITPWFESHVKLVVPCSSDNNPDCTLKLQTPSKRVGIIPGLNLYSQYIMFYRGWVMLSVSVSTPLSRYRRPWIKLLVSRPNPDTTTSIKTCGLDKKNQAVSRDPEVSSLRKPFHNISESTFNRITRKALYLHPYKVQHRHRFRPDFPPLPTIEAFLNSVLFAQQANDAFA